MSNYERDKAEAEAVHRNLTMEWQSVVAQARAPLPPPKPLTLWQRIRAALADLDPVAKKGE